MSSLAAIFQPCTIPSCCSRVTTAVALSKSFMKYFYLEKSQTSFGWKDFLLMYDKS